MVLIILEMVLHCRGRLCGFRPLAGIMVLIFVPGHVSFRVLPRFRPLAGIMVLIMYGMWGIFQKGRTRFRPLAGIMVLIGFISVKDPVVGKTEGNYICM